MPVPLGPGDAERVVNTVILSAEEKERGTFMVRLLSLIAFPALRLFTRTATQRTQNKNPLLYLLAIQRIITLFLRNSRTYFKDQNG